MGFSCGIVGLPNVGKSTLFNALTATAAAAAANYPFCTIEPNMGRVPVPDLRLDKLASIAGSKTIIPTQLEFWDIAGLVRGASKGEGLGNQFLGHIRSVDAILHMVRCFEDSDITHVDHSLDPIRDIDTINTELLLADIASLEKRLGKKNNPQEELIKKLLPFLDQGNFASSFKGDDIASLDLLTSKPMFYVCNVADNEAATGNQLVEKVKNHTKTEPVIISAAIESEISQLQSKEEQIEFLESIGLKETGLSKVIQAGYKLLDLITFFTVGPKEARAWTISKNTKAPDAAGVIHTDFSRGFIAAATISYDDYLTYSGENGAKDNGKYRVEGKEYTVCDGDVIHFRFNV